MTTSLAPGLASTAMSFDGASQWRMAQTFTPAGAWSISLWVQCPVPVVTTSAGILGGGFGSATNSSLYVDFGGMVVFAFDGLGGTIRSADAAFSFDIPHHVVITCDGTTMANSKCYIDGVDVTVVGGVVSDVLINTIGAAPYSGTVPFSGLMQDIAAFDKQMSAAEVLASYNLGRGYVQEESTTRVDRVLDDVGWPSAWREISSTYRAMVGELVYNAAPALTLLQEVERTEQGLLFVTKAGYVAFRDRYYRQESTAGGTVQQVFSDDGDAASLGYSTFGFCYNDRDVTNDATVTTPTTWAKSSDATSITANGLQSDKVDTILTSFTDANSMAAGLVAQGKDATWRAAPIMVYPVNNTTRWDDVLSLELGYRVSMEITPMSVGSQNAQDVMVEQLEWLIENGLWALTVAGSPVRDVWFIIGSSLIGGSDVIGY